MYDFNKLEGIIPSEELNNIRARYIALNEEIKLLSNENKKIKYKEKHNKYGKKISRIKDEAKYNLIVEKLQNYNSKKIEDTKIVERLSNRIKKVEKKLNNLSKVKTTSLKEQNYINSKNKKNKNLLNRLNRRKNNIEEEIIRTDIKIRELELQLKELEKDIVVEYEKQEEYEQDLNIKNGNLSKLKDMRKELRLMSKELEERFSNKNKIDRSENNMPNTNELKYEDLKRIYNGFEVDTILKIGEIDSDFLRRKTAVLALLHPDMSNVDKEYVASLLDQMEERIARYKREVLPSSVMLSSSEVNKNESVAPKRKPRRERHNKVSNVTPERKRRSERHNNKVSNDLDAEITTVLNEILEISSKISKEELKSMFENSDELKKFYEEHILKIENEENITLDLAKNLRDNWLQFINMINSIGIIGENKLDEQQLVQKPEEIAIYVTDNIDDVLKNVVGIRKVQTEDGHTIVTYDFGDNKQYTSIIDFSLNKNVSNAPMLKLQRAVKSILDIEEQRKIDIKNDTLTKKDIEKLKRTKEGFKTMPATTAVTMLEDTLNATKIYFEYKQIIMYLKAELGEAIKENNQSMIDYLKGYLSKVEPHLSSLEGYMKGEFKRLHTFSGLWNNAQLWKYPEIDVVCENPSQLYELCIEEQKEKYRRDTKDSINSKHGLQKVVQSVKAHVRGSVKLQKYIEEKVPEKDAASRDLIVQKLAGTSDDILYTLDSSDLLISIYGEEGFYNAINYMNAVAPAKSVSETIQVK